MMLASVTGRSVTEGRIGVPQKMRLFLFPQSECAFPLKPPAPPFSPAQANRRRFSGPGPFGKIADAHKKPFGPASWAGGVLCSHRELSPAKTKWCKMAFPLHHPPFPTAERPRSASRIGGECLHRE